MWWTRRVTRGPLRWWVIRGLGTVVLGAVVQANGIGTVEYTTRRVRNTG